MKNPAIEGLGNDVLGAKIENLVGIGAAHDLGDRFAAAREFRQGLHRGLLHRFVDLGCSNVERTAKDEGKPEHVVDLVGVVRTTGGGDGIRAYGHHILRRDLGVGVRHGEDDGAVGHRLDHLLAHKTRLGETDKNIGSLERVGEGSRAEVSIRELLLVGVHAFFAALVDHAPAIAEKDVLGLDTQILVELCAGDPRRSGTGEDHADVRNVALCDQQGVEQRRAGDDRRAVLVVVKDRDVERVLEPLFDLETLRSPNVLQVDPTKGGCDQLAGSNDLFGVGTVDLDVEYVDIGKTLEEDALALHDRLTREGPDVAESENRGPVRDDGNQVPLGRVAVDLLRVGGRSPGRVPPPPGCRPAKDRPGSPSASWERP